MDMLRWLLDALIAAAAVSYCVVRERHARKERRLAEERLLQINAELERQKAELSAANAELEAFSYSAAHDLRAPLRAIDGFSGMLLDEYSDKLGKEGLWTLGIIRRYTDKMGRLIEALIALARLGRWDLRRESVDMEALARDAFEEARLSHPGRAVRLQIAELPNASGDRGMLRQVLVNLLSNAMKFTKLKDLALIEVGARLEGRETVYWVKDNGAGFDMARAQKLFTAFQRLHAAEAFDGTGIGLAIVSRVVVRHGGRVWARGEVGEGAVFYFALPRKDIVDSPPRHG